MKDVNPFFCDILNNVKLFCLFVTVNFKIRRDEIESLY